MRQVLAIIIVCTVLCAVLDTTKSIQLSSCMDIEEVYLEDVDLDSRTFYVRLGEPLVQGSDGACMAAGIAINKILEDNPEWVVLITNEWVPSSKNPIDLEWSRVLAQGY